MNITWEIKNNNVWLEIPFDMKDTVKQIPGRRWAPTKKQWYVPYNEDAVALANSLLGTSIPAPQVDRVMDTDCKPASDLVLSNLYQHQKISVTVARTTKHFADLSEPGTGKTLVQIELLIERNCWPVLIVCPKSIMEAVWVQQLLDSGFDFNIVVLEGGSAKVKKQLQMYKEYEDLGNYVFIINYDMVARALKELQDLDPNYIILDESTKIKTPGSARSKAIIKMRDYAQYRSIMTGTVAPNGLQDIFNQMKFINPLIFGDSFYAFRHNYFTQGGFKNYEWFPKPNAIQIVAEKIKGISVQHHKRDCVDLPPLVEEIREIEMTPEQQVIYEQMKEDMVVWLSETKAITAPFVITKLMKLRQIASGFIYNDGESIPVSKKNPKDTAVFEILEQIGNQKCIIFAHFNSSIDHISDLLTGHHISYTHHRKDMDAIDHFKRYPNCQILLANPASAGHGLNLQFCSNIIYYEQDFNLENHLQSIQRIERIGQQNKMTVYYLITKRTVEKYIHKRLQMKEDINRKLDINEFKEGLNGLP
jgi:SNF2 family DNA or RNA helicase